MKFEHLAMNVPDPAAMANWYVENLGMRIVKKLDKIPNTHFVADENGMMLEIYCNQISRLPDYQKQGSLELHLALTSEDPKTDMAKLTAAGARLVIEENLPDGSLLIMMNDPWGVSLQLCKRANPIL